MTKERDYTRAVADLSSEQKFQFEFFCDHCGKGYRSDSKQFLIGKIGSAMGTASDLFGGVFNKAAEMSEQARSTSWQRAHDQAQKEMFLAIKPGFSQCSDCRDWVCREDCWEVHRSLCKDCAAKKPVEESPEPEVEAAQVSPAASTAGDQDAGPGAGAKPGVEQQEGAAPQEAASVVQEEKSQPKSASLACSNCGSMLRDGAKFCPSCGSQVEVKVHCIACGTVLPANAKFCPECGTKSPV